MTDEEMNRKMEFIVEQQAIFAVDIQILKERQDRFQVQLETTQGHLETMQGQLVTMQGQLVTLKEVAGSAIESSTKASEVVTVLAESQIDTQRQMRTLQRQVSRVARLLETHVRQGHPPEGERDA